MLPDVRNLRLKSTTDVWVFATLTTCVSMFLSNRLVWLLFSSDLYDYTAGRAAIITFLLTMPICLVVGVSIRHITALSAQLEDIINRDRLTNLATRDFFFGRMEENRGAHGVSLMVDIDNFKAVNDSFGHLTGDDVIKSVGAILRAETREEDIVCRFGGEEFVIFLHGATRETGQSIAERMRTVIHDHPTTVGKVTVSIGGSVKKSFEDIEVSIKSADDALYRAKRAGRNKIVFDPVSREAAMG